MQLPDVERITPTLTNIASKIDLTTLSVNFLDTLGDYLKENGRECATGAAIIVTSITVSPVLGLVGFTPIGPAAGTFATIWQSSLGSVEAGTLFAMCQSIAMGGVATNVVPAIGAMGAGVVALPAASQMVAGIRGWFGN
ncbi:hypothetical protein I7I51_05977 [Histoplasma capsulatum]|uniref:Uncharacterized protein n=1 Tax=Ajellomyces capsulatus TaxID=5037 RepID=A0A8A1MGX1_AJECA|nr:hypothetical protein I7I51_05977 [Histoplasma capsulatum]